MGKQKVYTFVDLLCGAGGTSSGAMLAAEDLGLEVDLACVNHWNIAIATHKVNHPGARHYCQDVGTLRPIEAVPSGRLDLLMASPTCTHHSRARGGKPTSDQKRSDPWHVVTWLTELRVKRLFIENVPEFREWGPVDPRTGRPVKSKKGQYFRAWVKAIEDLGFKLDWRIVNCADYGDGTTRERFFMIGRSDGKKLVWEETSHAKNPSPDLYRPALKPWRPAREFINWEARGLSIFNRRKPLAPKTILRIWAGATKFYWPDPFLVVLRNHMDARSIDYPLPTITSGGTHIGLAQPVIMPQFSDSRLRSVNEPVPTLTKIARPALVQPIVLPLRNGNLPRGMDEQFPALTTQSDLALAEPFIMSGHAGGAPRSSDEPIPSMTTKNNGPVLITPYYGSGSGTTCKTVDQPLDTITTKARFGMVMPVTHGGSGNRARSVDQPLPTLTTAHRGEQALVVPEAGVDYDILFRMLLPEELAAATSFIDGGRSYHFVGNKTEVTAQIGNAVPIYTAKAIIKGLMRDAAASPQPFDRKAA